MPISHVSLPVSCLKSSKAFYEAVLKPLSYTIFMDLEDDTVGFANKDGNSDFWILQCPKTEVDKEAAKISVAFEGESHAQVNAFHEAALAAGAEDMGKPGEEDYLEGYYTAYVLDPDRHIIECVYDRPNRPDQPHQTYQPHQPWWLSAIKAASILISAAFVGGLSWWIGAKGCIV